jgi:hypothetical protein
MNPLRVSPAVAFSVNSAFAFASAQLLTAALHEAGHGIAAHLLGFSPHIYAFYEDNPAGTAAQTLTILAAGPVASLLLGGVFWLWYRRSKPRYSFGRLLLLWLALLGVMTFVNYLIVTPWLSAGDTAQFADVLGWSTTTRYGMAAIGVVLLFALARPAATAVLSASPRVVQLESPRARRRYIFRGFYLPLIAGVALTVLAGIGGRPLNVAYELLATVGNIDIVAAAMYAGSAPPRDDARAPDEPLRIAPAATLLYVALVLVYVLAFSRGVPV